ncbi:sensor histidine kinase [Pseudomonas sp. NY15463]|uniref:sensor histidine kinase n=1 Tax=Pseudomonas sp. NY15463 TaxID=3400361 RepID=UPI003A897EAC
MTEEPNKTVDNESIESQSKDVGLLFLANFVHQVVNPLNGVIGTLHNITDDVYGPAVVKQKINASRAQLEQCVTLIRNLAYLSDFFFETSEKTVLRNTREGATSILPQTIIESLQFFQVSADKKKIRFELTDPITQYRISARPELLKQIFLNLFDNWLKYGKRDQIIEITPTVNKKNDLVVSISGASIGFDNADADRIFEMGYRSKEAEGKVAQGSGIGLFICREIAEKVLGGGIKAVHSSKNNNTTFTLVIPPRIWKI